MTDSGDSGLDEKEVTVVKNATDLQRLKLEKLMKNPEKLAFIPDRPKDKKFSDPAEFVRNVMGSSAGAGSGEFHVYRHIRRREYARQDFLQDWKEKEELDRVYREKIKANREEVEKKASKKRCKRQRQKEKQKAKQQKLKDMKKKGIPIEKSSSSSSDSSEDDDKDGEKNSVGKEETECDGEVQHPDAMKEWQASENYKSINVQKNYLRTEDQDKAKSSDDSDKLLCDGNKDENSDLKKNKKTEIK